jgi:two-component system sensor histidine kinase TctE
VTVEVSDNGRGVAADKVERLTKRFERGGHSGHGAGLGLAIVEEIAALFGGRLSISSSEGKGFTAVVRFPAVTAA